MPGLLYGSNGRMKSESKVEMPLTAVALFLKFCLYFVLSGCLLITWTVFLYFREQVIKHSLVHKVFLDFFQCAPEKQRTVSLFLKFPCIKEQKLNIAASLELKIE